AIAPVKDFSLVERDRFAQPVYPDVLDQRVELCAPHQREPISERMEFEFAAVVCAGRCGYIGHCLFLSGPRPRSNAGGGVFHLTCVEIAALRSTRARLTRLALNASIALRLRWLRLRILTLIGHPRAAIDGSRSHRHMLINVVLNSAATCGSGTNVSISDIERLRVASESFF